MACENSFPAFLNTPGGRAWWEGVGVCAVLFYVGALDFVASTKICLYGISIWLNGWLLVFFSRGRETRSKMNLYHDCLVVWMLSYAMTNLLWEIPWVIFSPFVFTDFENLPGGLADTPLALAWTQYQYLVFPLIFGILGWRLLREDWRTVRGAEESA